MDLQSLTFLFLIFILLISYRLLFRDDIFWDKLFHHFSFLRSQESKAKQLADKCSEKFRSSSLFQATLKVLDLEEHDVPHIDAISDRFLDFSELSEAIKAAGLDSSNIIVGVDFTASNEWQGRNSFDRKSLHTISKSKKNPYQKVITTIASTLSVFDEDNLIPAYGFGDVTTKDKAVFSFTPDESPCKGFLHVLECYENVVKMVELSGPTSFVPIIEKAVAITKKCEGYHILIIVADGQVEEEADYITKQAIIRASYYPLSIIVVGVGDGPWDNMVTYDEKLPSRLFDNFQFVDYSECTKKSTKSPELTFALHALMEIPDQYKKIKELGLLERKNGE